MECSPSNKKSSMSTMVLLPVCQTICLQSAGEPKTVHLNCGPVAILSNCMPAVNSVSAANIGRAGNTIIGVEVNLFCVAKKIEIPTKKVMLVPVRTL